MKRTARAGWLTVATIVFVFSGGAPLLTATGPWQVHFDSQWGGTESVVLEPWEDSAQRREGGIRYFSGTANGYQSAGAEAAIQFGRFLFEPCWRGKNACLLTVGQRELVAGPAVEAVRGQFRQLAIRVTPQRVSYACDGQLVYADHEPSPTTPWLALVGRATRRTAWRNLRVTGHPRILPEVSLIHDQRMDGWMSPLYRESLPRQMRVPQTDGRASAASPSSPPNYAWYALDHVLYGRCMKTADRGRAIQSWLAYHRPLLAGDTLTYEFWYEPGEKLVHPSLGRTALLLEAGGVRLHWITDVPHMTIGGLSADNAVTIAESRRGPIRLPLLAGQWNQVTIHLDDDGATILLNGREIYVHPLSVGENRLFGLFHFANRTAAEVRSIVLRGDWPASLSDSQLAYPLALTDAIENQGEQRVRGALTDPSWIKRREPPR